MKTQEDKGQCRSDIPSTPECTGHKQVSWAHLMLCGNRNSPEGVFGRNGNTLELEAGRQTLGQRLSMKAVFRSVWIVSFCDPPNPKQRDMFFFLFSPTCLIEGNSTAE